MKKVLIGAVVAVAAALLTGATFPARASATPATPASASVMFIHNYKSGLCLDGSITQGVRLNTCNSGSYQKWAYDFDAGGRVVNQHSGLCLDGSISQGVRLNTCNGSLYQSWWFDEAWAFENDNSGLCLDGSVTQGVRLNDCNNSDYQTWVPV